MLVVAVFLMVLTGCTYKETYRVMLKNETNSPLTVGFVKNGPPAESMWASPEDRAFQTADRDNTRWGEVIPAGKTADVQLTGTFHDRIRAFLRVYQGTHTTDELLAISRGSGNRLDLILDPTRPNGFIISNKSGKLVFESIRPVAPAKPQ